MDRNFHFYNAANILAVAFPVIAGSAFTQFDPHFEEVKSSVEPWLMARWKARLEFLLSVIELLYRQHSRSANLPVFSLLRGRF